MTNSLKQQWLHIVHSSKVGLNTCFILFCILNFACNHTLAQQQELDSLKKLLIENNSNDESQLHLLNAIVPFQVNIKPNDALINADKAIAIAQKLNKQKQLATAYYNKGFILLRKSHFDEALTVLQKSIDIYAELKQPVGIADNQILIAEIKRRLGETDTSKIILEKALVVYNSSKNLKGKADVYYYLALVNRDLSEFDNILSFCNKAIDIYKSLGDEAQLAATLDAKCGYYYFKSEYSMALKYCHEALKVSEKNHNQYGLAMSFASFGHIYSELPDFPKAVDNHLKALKIHEQMDNYQMQGGMNVNIGLDFYELKKYDLALSYTEKGIKIFDSLKINNGQYRISIAYMGMIYQELGDIKKSLAFTERAIKLCLTANDNWALSDAYNCLGNNYFLLKKYDLAIIYFRKTQELIKLLNAPVNEDEYSIGMGKAIASASNQDLIKAGISPENRNKLVLEYFTNALQRGIEINNKNAQQNAYEQLSLFYERMADIEKSYAYYRKYITIKDSIDNVDNANAVALLQLQYDTEKKEQQIALLTKESQLQQTEIQKQKSTRNIFIGGFALVVLLAGISFNRYRLKKKANAQIEQTLTHLRNTQEQIIEREKLASLGKLTVDVAKQIEIPINAINQLNGRNRVLLIEIINHYEDNKSVDLKTNLDSIYNYGKDIDRIVKSILAETRKL